MRFNQSFITKFILATSLFALFLQLNGKENKITKTKSRGFISLKDGFVSPPDSVKPWVNMWWFDNVTATSITQHLEELKDKGAGGVMIIDVNGMPDARYMTDKWRELFRHTVAEASRLGLKVGTNICAGWPSGGGWIKPENASKMVVHSEKLLNGPQKYSGKLVESKGKDAQYQIVSVQAFPISENASNTYPIINVSADSLNSSALLDGSYMTEWKSGGNGQQWIVADYGAPHLVDWGWVDIEVETSLEASDDGHIFRPIALLKSSSMNTFYGAIPPTKGRWFRLKVPNNSIIHDFSLGSQQEVERFTRLASKRAITNGLGPLATRQIDQANLVREDLISLPNDQPLKIKDRIDLTKKVSKDGTLNWDVPPGKWKIVQIGYFSTGLRVADGYLPDYLSPKASEINYEKGMKPLIGDAGTLTGKTYQYFIEDNVETPGIYSWTPKLMEEFQKRRSYNPTPYLSTLAGEIVENARITDRFLADFRRTIADCVADGHYGRWAELAHADGMKVRAEAGGQYLPRLLSVDGLMNQGRVDVPVAEFWESTQWKENQWNPQNHHEVDLSMYPHWEEEAQNVDAKQTASAAHLYGKRLVGSEAFTSMGSRSHWGAAPSDLIRSANIAFCEGINAISIHGSATSGPENGLPGKEFWAGTHFNHNITWWNQGAKQFLSYLSRCQYLLQQGLFVADVLYYNGDEVPTIVPPKNIDPSRGFGYDYDVCNTEILLTRLSVKNGRIMLPDGASYSVLVLPDRPVLPLSAALKIKELVVAGATVIGPKPERTPGLTDYPNSEKRLLKIAEQVWGESATSNAIQHSYGKGRVIYGPTIKEILSKGAISTDFAFKSDTKNDLLDFIHRSTEDTEIYFVTNRRGSKLNTDCTFRVSGKQPELWDPITGSQRDMTQFESKNGCTSIPLEFEPYSTMFVIFKKQISNSAITTQTIPAPNFPKLKTTAELSGPWNVQFNPEWFYPITGLSKEQSNGLFVFNQLEDWSKRQEPAIKYFSGSAVYKKTFQYKSEMEKKRVFIDLNSVNGTAHVSLNSKDLGVIWCNPWRVEITDAIKAGENNLEVKIVNLWPNRLIGDANLPLAERKTSRKHWTNPKKQTLPSGLIGPVRILED
jgi:alpha-L-rhamnosidase